MELSRLIRYARGHEAAELFLAGARLVNVYTGEIQETGVAVADSCIVGIGPAYAAHRTIDLQGAYLAPGFIDAHVHIESSMVTPYEFARAVVPHGTTTAVADAHEIANVLGLDGLEWLLAATEGIGLDVFLMMPSCVPASSMETAGARLGAADLAPYLGRARVLGLGEMMNFPGLLAGDEAVLDKLRAFRGAVCDGHAPGLGGRDLVAYAAAVGSDHECTSAAEAMEKLRLGMTVFVREGTTARNLDDLLPAITAAASRRMCFCSDDRHPADLLDEGHIDHILRLAIDRGLDPIAAIRMATLNAAEYFRLGDRGAIAPGKRADLVVFDDLGQIRPTMVWRAGRLVARDGGLLGSGAARPPTHAPGSMNVDWSAIDLRIGALGTTGRAIGLVADQLVTEHLVIELPIANGQVVADPRRDLAKLAVIERHHGSGRFGLGLVRGLGLARGAIASSVAHDSHNIVVAGIDDDSMMLAARTVHDMGGGLAAVAGAQPLASLRLPIAGLMSDRPIEEVRAAMDGLLRACAGLGCSHRDPFMALSFVALPVIPALKLTDRGLVDVSGFEIVPLFV